MSYPPPPSYSGAPAGRPMEDPGKTLSIIGIVLAFFCSIGGLICGIIGMNKSKAAGFSGQLGLIATILSAVLMVGGFILGISRAMG